MFLDKYLIANDMEADSESDSVSDDSDNDEVINDTV